MDSTVSYVFSSCVYCSMYCFIANSSYEQKALKRATEEYSELHRYSKVSEMVDGEWVEISYEQRKKEHEQRAKEYLPNRKKR